MSDTVRESRVTRRGGASAASTVTQAGRARPGGQSHVAPVLPGFADPVHQAHAAFRAVLDALARPTRPVAVPVDVTGPAPLTCTAAALLLALCDDATPLWLDQGLRAGGDIDAWARFHTGAPIVDDPVPAAFAMISEPAALPGLTCFGQGTDESPHMSATVIVLDADGAPGEVFIADGPGFERPTSWTAPAFPADFTVRWAANHARFPRGVDVVVAGRHTVTGLPRTTALTPVARD